MSAELAARDRDAVASAMLEARRRRAQGRRLAVAASSGLVLAVAADSTLPFLAPVFAVQLLAASRRPLSLQQMLRSILLVVVLGYTLALVSSLLGDRPAVFAPLLLAIYFVCFLARAKVGPAVDLVLLIAVIVPLLDVLHPDLGESIAELLAKAMAGGVLLAWMAHAFIPDPGDADADADAGPPRATALRPVHRAFASASILLGAMLACFVDSRLSSAVVIPVTAATLLGHLDLAATGRSALGLVLVNLMGGAAALLVFTVVEIEPTLLCLFLATLAVCLLFGGRAAAAASTGGASVGALIIFLILLGLGVSPLPTSTPESFSTRIWFVLFATLYTLCCAAAFWPQPRKALQASTIPLSAKPKLDGMEAYSRCVG